MKESIRRILREETEPGKYLKAVKLIAGDFKNEEFVCDIDVSYYADKYEVVVEIDRKEFEKKYENLDINYANILMTGYLDKLKRDIRKEIKNFLPVDLFIWFKKTNCDKSLNESEGKKGKYINSLEDLTEDFKNEDCVCDIEIEYRPEEFRDAYLITVVLGNGDLDDKFNGISWRISDYRTKLKRKITKEVLDFLPIPFYVEFKQTPRCYKDLQESEEKKPRLLSTIEEDGLYQVMKDTSLSLPQVISKTGELSREVLERYIMDFMINEAVSIPGSDGDIGFVFPIPLSTDKEAESFYLSKGVVTVEINEYGEYGMKTSGSYERLVNLSDDEIYKIVKEMIDWGEDTYYEI